MAAAAVGRGGSGLPEHARPLVGDWRVRAGSHSVTYSFAEDGTFSLLFSGLGGGRAGGTWKLEGNTLVLDSASSSTPLAQAGQRETAQIARVTPDTLTLAGKDYHGRDRALVLHRAAPFVAGRRDDPEVVGSWQAAGADSVLILADDGTAVFSRGAASHAGQWSQSGRQLVIRAVVPGAEPEAPAPATRPAGSVSEAGVTYEDAAFHIVSLDEATLSLRLIGAEDRGNGNGRNGMNEDGRVQVFKRMTADGPTGPATQPGR